MALKSISRCVMCSQREYCERKEIEGCEYFIPEKIITADMLTNVIQQALDREVE